MKAELDPGTELLKEARADIKELNIHSKDKPDPTIKPPTYDIISEGFDPDDKSLPNVPKPPPIRLINEDVPLGIGIRKENSTMNHIAETIESGWLKFANWVKKSIAMMIIFILLGGAGGLYIAKIIYDIRMDEISKLAKTGTAGYVHKGYIYDVKLRP